MSATTALRIGVVGYGFGRFHVQTLIHLAGVDLVAVADAVRYDELCSDARRYDFEPYRDANAMIAKERLDALCVCVPPAHRAAIVTAALEADVALFIEKPWASDPTRARELAAACAQARRPVMAGFSFRFHPAMVKLSNLLAGPLGAARMLMASYVISWLPPRDHWTWDPANGNGFINENSCHLIDAVCSLMGEPRLVYASGKNYTDSGGVDAASIHLSFADGAVAALACGGIGATAFHNHPQMTVWTANGQAELVGEEHIWRELRWALAGDQVVQHYVAPPELLARTRYSDALQAFIDTVRTGTEVPALPTSGVRAVDIAEAVYRSIRSGEPVALPPT